MRKSLAVLIVTLLLIALLPTYAFAADGSMDHFQRNGNYTDSIFRDVSTGAWYKDNIAAAYELGFMRGRSSTAFAPDSGITIAEAIAMAARLHCIYTKGKDDLVQSKPWYQVYVDYSVSNGLLKEGEFANYDAKATRSQVAHIFAAALPAAELTAINKVAAVPDLSANAPYREEIFRLYEAGILGGNDRAGTFRPDADISRAEAAAVITRMALPELRKELSLPAMPYTNGLPVGEAYDVPINMEGEGQASSVTVQPLSNGYTRFTLTYQVPEGYNISVFNPPEGSSFMFVDESGTTAEESKLVFDLTEAQMKGIEGIYINFFKYDDENSFGGFIPDAYLHPIPHTNGAPVGDPYDVPFGMDGNGHISSLTAQALDNGYTRFTLAYQVPEGFGITVFNPPDGLSFSYTDARGTTAEKSKLEFDLSAEQLDGVDEVTIIFFKAGDTDSIFVSFPTNFLRQTGGKPVGEPNKPNVTLNQLTDVGGQVKSLTIQALDNGYTRFTLTYTIPEGMEIAVFDPPDGEHMYLIDLSKTTGKESTLVFDLSEKQLDGMDELAIVFANRNAESNRKTFWLIFSLGA